MKILITILLALTIWSASFGADIAGQDNTVIFSDYITGVYYEAVGFISIANAHLFADSTMVKFMINMARENAVRTFGGTERDTIFGIATTTEEYTLPADFYEVRHAASIALGTGKEVAMKEVSGDVFGTKRDDTGKPAFYTISERKIKIAPCNTSNDSVAVHYNARSNVLTANTDTCNIDKDFKEYIILTAAESILRIKRISLSSVYTDKRLEDIAVFKEAEANRLDKRKMSLFETIAK